jgi:hypothetical protein
MDVRAGIPTDGATRPGPIYDAVMRGMFEADLPGACQLLGVPITVSPQAINATFPATTFSADLLARVGPNRLMHVEYVRKGSDELVPRMLIYRGLILRDHPKHVVSQHVIVLGEGRVQGHDDFAKHGFTMDLHVLYLRDADPQRFLGHPNFAPLAVLPVGDPQEQIRSAKELIDVLRRDGGDRTAELLEFAWVLARITIGQEIMGKIAEEDGMSLEAMRIIFRETALATELRAEGRDEGREQLLEALLHDRFGAQPELVAVAQNLARWADVAAAIHAVTAANSFEDVLKASAEV